MRVSAYRFGWSLISPGKWNGEDKKKHCDECMSCCSQCTAVIHRVGILCAWNGFHWIWCWWHAHRESVCAEQLRWNHSYFVAYDYLNGDTLSYKPKITRKSIYSRWKNKQEKCHCNDNSLCDSRFSLFICISDGCVNFSSSYQSIVNFITRLLRNVTYDNHERHFHRLNINISNPNFASIQWNILFRLSHTCAFSQRMQKWTGKSERRDDENKKSD